LYLVQKGDMLYAVSLGVLEVERADYAPLLNRIAATLAFSE
jgi:hypothetical protein